jgi:hypothetical protein
VIGVVTVKIQVSGVVVEHWEHGVPAAQQQGCGDAGSCAFIFPSLPRRIFPSLPRCSFASVGNRHHGPARGVQSDGLHNAALMYTPSNRSR